MKLDEIFPRKYATGADLQGRSVTLTISHVQCDTMRPNPRAKPEQKYVVYFQGAQKA